MYRYELHGEPTYFPPCQHIGGRWDRSVDGAMSQQMSVQFIPMTRLGETRRCKTTFRDV